MNLQTRISRQNSAALRLRFNVMRVWSVSIMDFILVGSFVVLFFFYFSSLVFVRLYLSVCVCVCVCERANEPRLFTSFWFHENYTLIHAECDAHTPSSTLPDCLSGACTKCCMPMCACGFYIQKTNTRTRLEVATTTETMTIHSVCSRAMSSYIYLFIYAAAHYMFSANSILAVSSHIAAYSEYCIHIEWGMRMSNTIH